MKLIVIFLIAAAAFFAAFGIIAGLVHFDCVESTKNLSQLEVGLMICGFLSAGCAFAGWAAETVNHERDRNY
ncbi:MAG: hypothetical protein LBK50_01765 [Candidatus Nomurabacteria bacterium]|jgi:hypothetical protein|nr:hypothetical protein [Candidatus Nomurabacteria bacterium]